MMEEERLFGLFSQDGYIYKEQNPLNSVSAKCLCACGTPGVWEYIY